MKIPVIMHDDDEYVEVPFYLLGQLIATGRIRAFRRSTGWAVIGRDPVRDPGKWKSKHDGPERRLQRDKSCILCPELKGGECVSAACPNRLKMTSSTSIEM
ncbi:MAG TPA: hypothetical protein VFG19_12210 [Geobacteraceae bacterium]|nr:hypothetical protein [Geobacteraceae bacterium]